MISSKKLGWKVFTQHDVYQLKVVYTYICRTWRRIVKPVASNNSFGGGFRLSVASKHIAWAVRENKPNETMPQLFVQRNIHFAFMKKKDQIISYWGGILGSPCSVPTMNLEQRSIFKSKCLKYQQNAQNKKICWPTLLGWLAHIQDMRLLGPVKDLDFLIHSVFFILIVRFEEGKPNSNKSM